MGIKIVSGKEVLKSVSDKSKETINIVAKKPEGVKKYERYKFFKNLAMLFSVLASLGTIGYVTYHYATQGVVNLILAIVWAGLMLFSASLIGLCIYITDGKLITAIMLQNVLPALGIISIIKYPESILKGSWITVLIGFVIFIFTISLSYVE